MISAAIGSLVMGAVVLAAGWAFGAAVALPAMVIIVGAIAAAVVVGAGLDWIDKKTGATDKLNQAIRGTAKELQKKLPNDYSSYDKTVESALMAGLGA